MRNAITFTLLTTAAALQLGCSGDTTVVIIQQVADTGVAPTPVEDAGAPVTTADAAADGGEGAADATVSDAGAADATVDAAPVDAGYDAGFVRLADGGYYFDTDASLCGGRFVVLQLPSQDPAGMGRLLLSNNVMFSLKPSPPLTQSEAAAWCAARGARLFSALEASYLGSQGVTQNWCPQIWEGLADAGLGPCGMWLDYLDYAPWTDKFISSCNNGQIRTGNAPRSTLCVYR
jgi:hypothetical protein